MEKLEVKKISGFKSGFTTIELLIYIAIITVVTTVLTNFVIDATKTAAAARQARQVQQNTRLVMGKIMRDVRSANSYSVPLSDQLELTTDGQITGYYLDSGVIYYYLNIRPVTPVPSEAVSNSNIVISSLIFSKLDNTVAVALTAEAANAVQGSGVAFSLNSAFTPRQYVY